MRKPVISKVLSWLVLAPSAAALIVFSVVNRHAVKVDFWPFEFAPEIRLFAVVFGILAFGVLWGGLAAWAAGGAARRRGREAARRADAAEIEARALKRRVENLEADLDDARRADKVAALPPADAA